MSGSEATRFAEIEDVTGSTVSASLAGDAAPGLVFVAGKGYRIGQPGSFVRIPIGYRDLFGIVSQVGASAVPAKLAEHFAGGRRWITIQLIGEHAPGVGFDRGITQYPTIGDPVHLVTEDDLERIYGVRGGKSFVRIGSIAGAESIPAFVDLNKLVTRHSAIVGSTGSGKSTAVSQLLHAVASAQLNSARIIVIDLHGEYASALREDSVVFRVGGGGGGKELFVPYWALEFEELLSLTFGSVVSDAERGALSERIRLMKTEALSVVPRAGVTQASLNVDTPVPFSIHQLWLDLYMLITATHLVTGNQNTETVAFERDESGEVVDRGDAMLVRPPRCKPQDTSKDANPKVYLSQNPLNLRRPLDALAYRLRDSRYSFLFRPGRWTPGANGATEADLGELLADWLNSRESIAILDLSGVPREILGVLVGALLRIVYDGLFWSRRLSEGGRERPLLVVLEEAHAYVGREGDGPAANAVKRIVREGRKYGIGAMIVSQRPSELDPTVISQCGTLFALRLSNSQDRSQVTAAAPENLDGLFSLLPILRTGEVIVVGEAVKIPTRATIDPPSAARMPDSDDPLVVEQNGPGGWNREREPSDYSEVVELWRRQDSTPRRLASTKSRT